MEDFAGASDIRIDDVKVLLAPATPRCLATAHLGGVAIECKLKSLIAVYHRIAEWGEPGQRPKDPRQGSPIANPGHGIVQALKMMPDLYKRAKIDPKMLEHLAVVVNPKGTMEVDYISLRYSSKEFSAQALSEWKCSFNYVVGWINKNREVI
ncbi:hypothetical protein [Xanthomonas campestris]|uniref:hypothetical protein n=1 Tax=Xanthomonas campestris TaxID=339 RepID=UPI001E6515CC|nr:hypothetical protein [Xanthomonas campestris]MCD0252612.1 hypothetical protein [Xanthomonas campestris pv. campestris]MEB1902786.1 hypothetical protein [Xanthomonas campestris pv. campestris]WDK82616.1 hypothetical protein JH311_18365 [Xanthomonas campestris pv. campestris]WDK87832.1 hypothetical protein JH305_03330 [Xanthomonas campestris pv. campestris]WDK91970.1 hypothetical protein JH289_03375 [Xanthomonas campestris pv. campestris]